GDIGQLGLLAVAAKNAAHRRLHISSRTTFFGGRCRNRLASLQQRDIKMRFEAARKHTLSLHRLAGFARNLTVLRFQLASRLPAVAAEHGSSRGCAPVFEFPRFLEHEPEE